MKLVSWNVNGLRSALGKGFLDYVAAEDPDVICLQETKLQPEQAVFDLPGYHRYFNSADKKGYSGTAILTKTEPLSVTYDFGGDEHRHEGRIITAEYPAFYLVCCYTPNSQDGLKRLPYRMQWEDDLRSYLRELDGKKPVVYCGDLNVAHREIDLKIPRPTAKTPAFPTRSGRKCQCFWTRASWTPSATFTAMSRTATPGGAIASTPGTKMWGGALTTSLYPSGSRTR